MWIPGGLQLSVCVKGLRPVSILAKVMPKWANANKKCGRCSVFLQNYDYIYKASPDP